jgi:hypothetical protein
MTERDRAARRARDLEATILPRLEGEMARDPALRSALFAVSQYWNDNANDEVHGVIVFSRDETPRWPHACPPYRERAVADPTRDPTLSVASLPRTDRCTWCAKSDSWFSLDYEEPTWRAWEAYCHDWASQDTDSGAAYVPFVIVRRRGDDGSLEHEIVGDAIRPWLDAPDPTSVPIPHHDLVTMVYDRPDDLAVRHVLADALLERGDPRGEYLSLLFTPTPTAETRARAAAIFAEHHRSWMGRLAEIIPSPSARWKNGFVERAGLWVPSHWDTVELHFATPEWATLRSITFLPTSRQLVSASMTALRSLAPADEDALGDLATSDRPWAIERLGLARRPGLARRLAEPIFSQRLPRLRTLVLGGEDATPATADVLGSAPLWMRLDALHVVLPVAIDSVLPLPAAPIEEWMTTKHLGPPEIAFGTSSETGEPAGLWLHLHRSSPGSRFRAWITIDELGSPVDLPGLARSIGELPTTVRDRIVDLELRPSRAFTPRPDEAKEVASLAGIATRLG